MDKHGFTMAELLVVVAIIAILVAISIPTFTGQLEKARESTDMSNIRSAFSEAVSKVTFSDTPLDSVTFDIKLKSSGSFEYIDPDDLPFDLPENLDIFSGDYKVTFDFSGSRPSASFEAVA